MAKLSIQAGSTGVTLGLFIQSSTATDGSGLTGLIGTSSGLAAYYYQAPLRSTAVPITLTTASLTAPWTSGLFIQVDSTNMPGVYRFDIPNAALGTGANSSVVVLKGAAAMAPLPLEIELTGWNNQLTPGAAGGMFIAGTNVVTSVNLVGTHTGSLTGSVGSVAGAVGSVTGSVGSVASTATVILSTGTHANAVIPTVNTIASNVAGNVTGSVGSVLGTATVILSTGTHANAVIPTVNSIASNVAGNVTGSVGSVLGTATVILSTGTHANAVIPTVNSIASNVAGSVGSVVATVVLSTGTHAGAIIPTVNSIASNVAGNVTGSVGSVLGTATVILSTGTHANAVIPTVLNVSSGVNVTQVGSDSAVGTKFKRLIQGNVAGTVGNASSTTSIVTNLLSPSAAVTDQFKGRILTFDDATTTANLRGQSTSIGGSSSGGVLTVIALTDAPVNGDTFTIS